VTTTPPAAANRPTFCGRLRAELQRLALLAIVLGLLVIAGKYYGFDRLNEEIRARVEGILREHYAGLQVTVRSARRVAGQGVEIRGIRITEAGGRSASVLAEIDEIFAACDTRLPDFLTKPPHLTAFKIHRLKLRAERKPSGRWNLAHLLPLPPCMSQPPPTATITDAELEIVDPTQQPACSWALREIELVVDPKVDAQAHTVLALRGTLAGDHVERVEIDGHINPTTSQWEMRGAVHGMEFSPRLRAALPRELSECLAPLSSVRGRTFFGFHASQPVAAMATEQAPAPGTQQPITPPAPQFVIHGKISEGRIDDARLPEPLTDVEATIHCDNHGLLIDELAARCGPTELELSAAMTGFAPGNPISIDLAARGVRIENVPVTALPAAVAAAWSQCNPRGMADIRGKLQYDGRQWRPDLRLDCRELSLAYAAFPYRLTDGSGAIVLKPDFLSARLRLIGGSRPIDCRADIQQPGPDFRGWIELESDGGIPIDEKLEAALDPKTRAVVWSFRPQGQVSLFGRLERLPPDGTMRRQLRLTLHDCSLQYERFPYPIDKINGIIDVAWASCPSCMAEASRPGRPCHDGPRWEFRDLHGRNSTAEITCSGHWQGGEQNHDLLLGFAARSVPLDDELRGALPPSAQRLWSNLRPSGHLDDLAVTLRYRSGEHPWNVEVQAAKQPPRPGTDSQPIALEPASFHYPLQNLTGGFHYRDGRLELYNLQATHGRAAVSAEGHCTLSPAGDCRLELKSLTADRVEVDRELLAALPDGLAQSLGRFPLTGPINVLGSLVLLVPAAGPAPPQLGWNLQFDVENGTLAAAVPIEHIHGGLSLSGRQSAEGLFARGHVQIDSAMVRGIQLTGVSGPFWLDRSRLVFGALADPAAQQGAPQPVTARLLGGLASLDGELSLQDDGEFQLHTTLANADLAQVAQQLAPHQERVSGRLFALADASGSLTARHTWHGTGQVKLRDADLYELPAMIVLLKLLSIQRPDRTAFTNSNIDFRIEGDDLALDRIDFSGDVISLKGKGRLNDQRQLDLKFYPLVGREERHLPIIRPLLGETGREVMLIAVTGTLDQPEIRRIPFPRLDARLAQLFPELARDEPNERLAPNERLVPKIPTPREALNRLLPGATK